MQHMSTLLEAVQTYFDAIYYCDAERLDQVFHKQSSLFDADNGTIFVDPVADFRNDVATRPSPASIHQVRNDQIVLIDWLSDLSAVVKLRLHSHDRIFVDHLNFVRGDDGWKIVAKIWHLDGEVEIETIQEPCF